MVLDSPSLLVPDLAGLCCFLQLQTISGEGELVHQSPRHGGGGCTMVTATIWGVGNPVSGYRML